MMNLSNLVKTANNRNNAAANLVGGKFENGLVAVGTATIGGILAAVAIKAATTVAANAAAAVATKAAAKIAAAKKEEQEEENTPDPSSSI